MEKIIRKSGLLEDKARPFKNYPGGRFQTAGQDRPEAVAKNNLLDANLVGDFPFRFNVKSAKGQLIKKTNIHRLDADLGLEKFTRLIGIRTFGRM